MSEGLNEHGMYHSMDSGSPLVESGQEVESFVDDAIFLYQWTVICMTRQAFIITLPHYCCMLV